MIHLTIKTQQFFLFLTAVVVLSGCSKSEDKVDCHSGFNLYQVTANETQALSNVVVLYSQDPSPVNCEKYKDALKNYIDALEGYEKCALEFGYSDDWKESIRQSRESIDQLSCQ